MVNQAAPVRCDCGGICPLEPYLPFPRLSNLAKPGHGQYHVRTGNPRIVAAGYPDSKSRGFKLTLQHAMNQIRDLIFAHAAPTNSARKYRTDTV